MNRELGRTRAAALIVIVGLLTANGWCQKITKIDRERTQTMLREISSDIKKHYYDPKLHGVDWDAKVEEMRQKIDATDSMNFALSKVAAALDSLNDSHTFFLPPVHNSRYDYGWQAQVIGDRCFVIRVRPGSDAEKKGVKRGDELVALNGFTPDRNNLWKMEYVFNTLRPQPALRLDLRDPAGKQRQVEVVTALIERKRVMDLTGMGNGNDMWDLIRQEESDQHLGRARFAEVNDVGILKFPESTLPSRRSRAWSARRASTRRSSSICAGTPVAASKPLSI